MQDRTNNIALEKIKDEYGDQIEKYEYKVWKEAYLAKPPAKAFCAGFTRYRKCFKVTHVKLKDGRSIPVASSEDSKAYLIILIPFVLILIILLTK